MAIEIERKFRVSGNEWKLQVSRIRCLRQAYIARTDLLSMRVRIDGDVSSTLTIKAARSGIERHEYEYVIPISDAEELMLHREGSIIRKVRHIVPFAGMTWEIDVFEGDNLGLVVAEVELDRADRAFRRPEWLGDEVTGDRRFYNAELTKRPFSSWSLGR